MTRIVNLELFGHPVNIITLLALIVLAWFAAFVISSKASSFLPVGDNDAD